QHHLVTIANDAGSDQPTLALHELRRLDAEAATALARIVRELRALAVAVLGDDEQVALVGADDVHRDHLVALAQTHALDTAGVATHRARLLLDEADRLAHARHHQDVVVPGRVLNGDELVVVTQLDRDD